MTSESVRPVGNVNGGSKGPGGIVPHRRGASRQTDPPSASHVAGVAMTPGTWQEIYEQLTPHQQRRYSACVGAYSQRHDLNDEQRLYIAQRVQANEQINVAYLSQLASHSPGTPVTEPQEVSDGETQTEGRDRREG